MGDSYRQVKNQQGVIGWARLVPFAYSAKATFTAVADGGSVNAQINIDPGLPFILTQLQGNGTGDTATVTNCPILLVSIVDGMSQQLLSNIPIPREQMFGTRDFPRQLPTEIEIPPSDNLTITLTNKTGGALTTDFYTTLIGFKCVDWTTSRPAGA